MPWFHDCSSHPLNLQGLCLPPPENHGLFSVQGNTTAVLSSTESTAYNDFLKSKYTNWSKHSWSSRTNK